MDDGFITLYTDGSCLGNPGVGGWAFLLRGAACEMESSGAERSTTNNRMELIAVIEGLRAVLPALSVRVYTDSQYVQKGALEWLPVWKKRGWVTANRQPVKNRDLWTTLDHLCSQRVVSLHWVRGHAQHPENERVDCLARTAAEKMAISVRMTKTKL